MSDCDSVDFPVKEELNIEYILSETESFEDTLKKRKKYDKPIRVKKTEKVYLLAKHILLYGCPIISVILETVVIFFPKLNHDIKYSKEIISTAMGLFIGMMFNKDDFIHKPLREFGVQNSKAVKSTQN